MLNILKNNKWIMVLGVAFVAVSSVYFPSDVEAQTGIVQYHPGNLDVGAVTIDSTTQIATISGGGEGGYQRRYRVFCDVNIGGVGYGFYVQQLFSNPQPPITQPSNLHTVNPNGRITSYSIDGGAGPQGNYTLNRTLDGVNVGPSDNCYGAELSPAEYGFSFPLDISGLSIGTHTVQVSAYDESTQRQIYSQPFTFVITSGGGGGPVTITKESRTSLAIVKRPTVALQVNGHSSATVSLGARPTLTWAPDSVEEGNYCSASNTNTPVDSTWNGVNVKNGYGGGTQTVGPMNQVGTFTYSIFCTGLNGSVSSTRSVQITVGNAATFSCEITSPHYVPITRGGSADVTMHVVSQNGFDEDVTFSGSIDPIGPNSPVIEVPFDNNPQTSPYGRETSALISTSNSTTPDPYELLFRGVSTSGQVVDCPPVTVEVQAIAQPPVTPVPVQATTSSGCGTATVTWDGPLTRPAPEFYQVYRSPHDASNFQPIGTRITQDGRPKYSYTDGGPFLPDTRYVYAVAAIIGTQYSTLIPSNSVVPTPCEPSLKLSNKDLVKVNNNTQIPPNACDNLSNIFILPNRDIFKTGSKVYFNINVCNSGNQPVTGITVTEIDHHNLDDVQLVSKVGGCITSGSGAGPYVLRDLPAPSQPGQYTVCTIQISAKIAVLSDPPGFLHRFWNRAEINARGLEPVPVTTPPYLFSETGTPVRNETAP